MKRKHVVLIPKRDALDQWADLKRKLKAGEISFEKYAAAKRKLKPSILAT